MGINLVTEFLDKYEIDLASILKIIGIYTGNIDLDMISEIENKIVEIMDQISEDGIVNAFTQLKAL